MLDNLKCRLGFHKPAQWHQTFKHKCRTTNKGRSKKRWRTWIREIGTVTYCERCGKAKRKSVEMLTEDGEHVAYFDSMSEAAEKTGCPLSSIHRCCYGRQETTNGYRWKYIE